MEAQRFPSRSAHYREQAARLRGLSEQEPVGTLREALFQVACQYDELADSIERQIRRGDRSGPVRLRFMGQRRQRSGPVTANGHFIRMEATLS